MKLRVSICWLALLFTLLSAWQRPKTDRPQEYQIKAVFLFNFTQFVEWPASAFPEPTSPFTIGILGTDPFGPYLDETIRGETLNGHPLLVKHFSSIKEIDACHILFISESSKSEIKTAFEKVKAMPILTVGDMANFTKQGGMIRFITENNKTRIRINLEVAKSADLKISSKLLRLAEIVDTQSH